MFRYFLRTFQLFLMKFYKNFLGITLMVTAINNFCQHVPLYLELKLICESNLVYIPNYWHIFLLNFDVVGIILIVTILKKIFMSCSPLLGTILGYFWACFGICSTFWEPLFSHEIVFPSRSTLLVAVLWYFGTYFGKCFTLFW